MIPGELRQVAELFRRFPTSGLPHDRARALAGIDVVIDRYVPLTTKRKEWRGSVAGHAVEELVDVEVAFWVIFERIHVHPDRYAAFVEAFEMTGGLIRSTERRAP